MALAKLRAVMVPAAALASAVAMTSAPAGAGATVRSAPSVPSAASPVANGSLRITGPLRDGGVVTARGLSWRPGHLRAGQRVLSFEVAYTWLACARRCSPGADSTATPFAATRYIVGHADTGRQLKLIETATEVVQIRRDKFTFKVLHASRSVRTHAVVRAYSRGRPPSSEFVNGLPESRTASAQEYFQVDPPHYSTADGAAVQKFRVDGGRWRPMPRHRVFFTGTLHPGPHQVSVLTSNRAGQTKISFGWRVVPLPAPLRCRGSCWFPPHLNRSGRPMRWDWQIGRTVPLQRTGRSAVDIYDIDGFLTTRSQVHRIHTAWQASTLSHPKAVCYLDLAWEDYRPDGSPSPAASPGLNALFPATTLGHIYFGFPQERWVDFRQLDALKPMLRARIAMCARKGFDAVELDDIDSFESPPMTGFYLTRGDAQNYLAYAYNLVHSYGMTVLWKNAPELASWGARYTDGAVIEECYKYRQCASWRVFTADRTATQPTGKWVGEAEYGADHYVCNPGQSCHGRRAYAAFCRRVYGSLGFAAVKFEPSLNGHVFLPCPRGR